MQNKNFLNRVTKEMLVNGDFKKAGEIESEALGYYADKINSSLIPLNLGDVPYVIASLEFLSKNLRELYPQAGDYADELIETTEVQCTVVQANR